MPKICGICGNKIGLLASRVTLLDGVICADCFKNLGFSTLDGDDKVSE